MNASRHIVVFGRRSLLISLFWVSLTVLFLSLPASGVSTVQDVKYSNNKSDSQSYKLMESWAREDTGTKELDLRFDTFIMTAHAAWSYAFFTGELPARMEDLKDYLFFAPVCRFTHWEIEDDILSFGAEVFDTAPTTLEVTIPRPGTAAWQEEQERHRQAEFRAFHHRPLDPSISDVSGDDILEGRFSNYSRDKLYAFARSDREFRQLYWSWQLAGFLHAALREFRYANGRYPLSSDELLTALPPRSAAAWIAPITGERAEVGDTYDKAGILYRSIDDGAGFELLVPLFGAGAEHALHGNKHRFRPSEGYFPGEFFRRAEGTGDDTDLIYGI